MSRKSVKKHKGGKNQKGGELHKGAIRKEGNSIIFPSGFPVLTAAGNYDIIHQYDSQKSKNEIVVAHVDLLHQWVSSDILLNEPMVGNSDDPINLAKKIYVTDKKEILALVNWLHEGKQ